MKKLIFIFLIFTFSSKLLLSQSILVSKNSAINLPNYDDAWIHFGFLIGAHSSYYRLNYSEKYIVDKSPLNFKWTGFIRMIFPNSYIINCNRDPMDICWSNYKQYYSSSNLGFAYNLKKLGQFYNLYNEYMSFWEKINLHLLEAW